MHHICNVQADVFVHVVDHSDLRFYDQMFVYIYCIFLHFVIRF